MYLLQENGSKLLLETGARMLLKRTVINPSAAIRGRETSPGIFTAIQYTFFIYSEEGGFDGTTTVALFNTLGGASGCTVDSITLVSANKLTIKVTVGLAAVNSIDLVITTGANSERLIGAITCYDPGATSTFRNGFQFTLLTRGNDIRRSPGIVVRDILNNQPNTCSFTVDGQSAKPEIGEKIEIIDSFDGNRRLFAGTVQSVDQIYEGQTKQLAWQVQCIDFTWLFNRRRPFASFRNTSASDVVKSLVQNFAPGFTTNHVQTNLAKVTATFDGSMDLVTALNLLAGSIGGGHWYIDYDQDVHFFHVVPAELHLPPSEMESLSDHLTLTQMDAIPSTYRFPMGYYFFRHTFLYSDGTESAFASISNIVLCDGSHKLKLSTIPLGLNLGLKTCVGRRIYYNRFLPHSGGNTPIEDIKGYVQVNDNTTTEFTSWFGVQGADIAAVVATSAIKTYTPPPGEGYAPAVLSDAPGGYWRLSDTEGYAQSMLSDAPFAYWRLGESAGATTALDNSGNARSATATGTVTFGQASNLADGNTAALFDGSTGYLTTATPFGVAAAAAFSFECWFKPASLGAYGEVITTATAKAVLGKTSGNKAWFGQNGGGGTVLAGTTTLVAGTWYHVVGTYDGTSMRLYVNGILEAGPFAWAAFGGTHGLITIGRDATYGEYFDGTIDEAAVHAYALSAQQIANRYALRTSAITSVVAATAIDSSGNGKTGAIVKGVTLQQASALTDKAALFDGVTGVVKSTIGSTIGGLAACSLEGWINHNGVAWGGGFPIFFNLGVEGHYLHVSSGLPGISLRISGTQQFLYSPTALNTNGWHHIVATWKSGDSIRLYVDGVLVNTSITFSGVISGPATGFSIGAYDPTSPTFLFGGFIDECAYFTAALTAARVAAHYAAGLARLTPVTPVAYVQLSDQATTLNLAGGVANGLLAGDAAITSNYTTSGGVRFANRGWAAYSPTGTLRANASAIVKGDILYASPDVATDLENRVGSTGTKLPARNFSGHPAGPDQPISAAVNLVTGDDYWNGGWFQFKTAFIYRNGSVSYPSPASNSAGVLQNVKCTGIKGWNLTNIPIGPDINGNDVVGRLIYFNVGSLINPNFSMNFTKTPACGYTWPVPYRDPDWSNSSSDGVIVIPDNTTTVLSNIALTALGSSFLDQIGLLCGWGNKPYNNGALLSSDPIPIWPNPDGPSLEDVDPPNDINDANQELLHEDSGSQPFTMSTDLSQVRNRVFVVGSGSVTTKTAEVGAIALDIADVASFSPAGGRIKVQDPATGTHKILNYTGVAGVVGAAQVTLDVALDERVVQGCNVNNFFQADDLNSQQLLAKLELDKDGLATDGIHEYTIVDTSLKAVFQLYMRAYAELELFAQPIVTIRYATRDPKSKSGQMVHVDQTNPPCVGDFLIQEVQIDQIRDESNDLAPRYTVMASSTKFTLNDLLLQIIGGQIGNSSSSSSYAGVVVSGVSQAATNTATSTLAYPFRRNIFIAYCTQAAFIANLGWNLTAGGASAQVVNDDRGSWERVDTTAVIGGTASFVATTPIQLQSNPRSVTHFRTGDSVAGLRLWLGFWDNNPTDADVPVRRGVGMRFSTVNNVDNGLRPINWDGTTTTVTTRLAPMQPNTEYVVVIEITGNGTLATFSVGIVGQMSFGSSMAIPSGVLVPGTMFAGQLRIYTQTAAAKFISLKRMYVEYDFESILTT